MLAIEEVKQLLQSFNLLIQMRRFVSFQLFFCVVHLVKRFSVVFLMTLQHCVSFFSPYFVFISVHRFGCATFKRMNKADKKLRLEKSVLANALARYPMLSPLTLLSIKNTMWMHSYQLIVWWQFNVFVNNLFAFLSLLCCFLFRPQGKINKVSTLKFFTYARWLRRKRKNNNHEIFKCRCCEAFRGEFRNNVMSFSFFKCYVIK
jgi:hypothetical protein